MAGASLILPLCLAGPASAQLGAGASLQSDYIYRGRSLSEERPTAALNISYDHASGAYAGVSAIAVDTKRRGLQMLGHIDYVGYVRRSNTGPAWELGLSNANITYYKYGERSFRYAEVYGGILTDHMSVRAYYSPSYFGQDVKTLYVDVSGAVRPAPDWRLFGHVGVLTPVGGRTFPGSRRERYDLSVGVAAKLRNAELSLTASKVAPDTAYSGGAAFEGDAVTLGLTYFF